MKVDNKESKRMTHMEFRMTVISGVQRQRIE